METKTFNLQGLTALSRAELKKIIGGLEAKATDNNPVEHCSPSGCWAQCWVTCDDSNGNPGAACATYAVCE